MTRLLLIAATVLLAAGSAFGQGAFSYDNPTYFPNACKTAGQIAVIYSDGPSKFTSLIYNNLVNASVPAKSLNFFAVTTYLKDVTSNVPLTQVANGGSFIGMRWTTTKTLNKLSATEIAAQLESDCNALIPYTKKAPK
ncbi:hypothetical protein HDU93_005660, partial [Gonapodya sp. JEL0774]